MPRNSTNTARFAAIDTLCLLDRTKKPLRMLLERSGNVSLPRDRGLIMEIVYGVLRQRQCLDRCIEILSSAPIGKLDLLIHQALRTGLYQLLHLDRIPARAAVSETVEACKAAGIPKRLQGFVNAILREAARRREELIVAAATDRHGTILLNHPDWLVERWRQNFGEAEALRICATNNRQPILVLRRNSQAVSDQIFRQLLAENGITSLPGNYSPAAVVLPGHLGAIPQLPGYREGYFQVQDEAAQLATLLLGPFRPGGRYLDACAGLGGKTSHLVELARTAQLHIEAVEPDHRRRTKLAENLHRLFGDTELQIHAGRLETLQPTHPEIFDGVLIDAPCSGTGVIGRHPDIRWNRNADDLPRYHHDQITLLDQAVGMLRPGGILVYATCSLEPEENRQVVEHFLATHPAISLTDCRPHLPLAARQLVVDGTFAPRPDTTIDGFFAARMQRS